jgi:hypothetical protein
MLEVPQAHRALHASHAVVMHDVLVEIRGNVKGLPVNELVQW